MGSSATCQGWNSTAHKGTPASTLLTPALSSPSSAQCVLMTLRTGHQCSATAAPKSQMTSPHTLQTINPASPCPIAQLQTNVWLTSRTPITSQCPSCKGSWECKFPGYYFREKGLIRQETSQTLDGCWKDDRKTKKKKKKTNVYHLQIPLPQLESRPF